MGYAWLNVGSLALGLASWGLPAAVLARRKRIGARAAARLCAAGLSACALSLCLVILYLGHLVEQEDWSALLDTIGAFRLCAVVLLAGTLALNALALACRLRRGDGCA